MTTNDSSDDSSQEQGSSEERGSAQPATVVNAFFEAMEARRWEEAARHLGPDIRIDYTETGERFDGNNFLAMNQAYPEGWSIEVVETMAQGSRVAAQVRVTHGDDVFWCAGFYTVAGGVITEGTEHWVTERSVRPPAWRQRFVTTDRGGRPNGR